MATDNRRIVVLGGPMVGKTTIINQLVNKTFIRQHDKTIEESYHHHMVVDDVQCRLDILDTGGEVDFTGMRLKQLLAGEGFVLVYSIYDKPSAKDIRSYVDQIRKAHPNQQDLCAVLVANQCGEEDDEDHIGQPPEVISEQGVELAQNLGISYFEVSAKTRTHISEPFEELVRVMRRHHGISCQCVGKCQCNDPCGLCGKPKKAHDKMQIAHPWQDKKEVDGGCCAIQ